MQKTAKKRIVITILILILVDTVIGYLLFKSRSFSHLAMWKIIESNKYNDFYWQPKDAPDYFRFEPDTKNPSIFRNEISPLVKDESYELKRVIKVAKYVRDIKAPCFTLQAPHLKGDSPEGILRQIRKGAGANCFHRSILLSTYLSSLGIKSRLWTFENENFNGVAHTTAEVYINNLKKWIFIDTMLGFYVTENGNPLSLLELRERLLNGKARNISVQSIDDGSEKQYDVPVFYPKLIKCVFLRADNDFVNKYNAKIKYEPFSIFQRYIDKLPDDMRRGLDYLLGKRDIFIHFVDRFSKSLKSKIIIAKLLFYFFIFSLVSLGIISVIFSLYFLKQCFVTNLSKKDTRHR